MTLEELIEEGNILSKKRTDPNMYIATGFNNSRQPATDKAIEKEYQAWIETCNRFLKTYHKEDCALERFEKPKQNEDSINIVAILNSLKVLPDTCRNEKDEKAKSEKIVINVSQSQNINLDIVLQAIKDEIGRNGFEDLKDIEGDTEDAKKQNLLSKLKGFGGATLSNILANILTNPTIWTQLF